ncbi:Snf7-domain-containing protein [Gorgonomyces haynaldii]|nr:Snf7-domain-containing protein [Gorgonomyces haynaldii]
MQQYLDQLDNYTLEEDIGAMNARFPSERTEWNSASYDEKLQFWTLVLTEATKQGLLSDSHLLLSTNDLSNKFERQGMFPLCLDTVIAHLRQKKTLVDPRDLQKSQSWFMSAVTAPLRWSGILSQGTVSEYVFMPLLQQTATQIMDIVKKQAVHPSDYVFEMQELKNYLMQHHLQLNDQDMSMLFDYMAQQGLLTTRQSNTFLICRFRDKQEMEITDAHVGLVSMRKTVAKLQSQISELETKISTLNEQAKVNLQKGLKPKAIYHLKQKKILMDVYEKRLGSLHTLENIIHKIHQSQSDAETINSFQLGAETLKAFLSTKELQIDHVESTMDHLQDVLADHNEIETAIVDGQERILQDATLTDADVEDELEKMIEEEQALDLPSVPSHLPQLQEIKETRTALLN